MIYHIESTENFEKLCSITVIFHLSFILHQTQREKVEKIASLWRSLLTPYSGVWYLSINCKYMWLNRLIFSLLPWLLFFIHGFKKKAFKKIKWLSKHVYFQCFQFIRKLPLTDFFRRDARLLKKKKKRHAVGGGEITVSVFTCFLHRDTCIQFP